MHSTPHPTPEQKNHLHDVTALTDALKRLLINHDDMLREGGISKEMEQLEKWLEAERNGPAPAGVISEGGIAWLTGLRDRLKLSAEEAQRLEGEGGNPSSHAQIERIENLMQTVRRIDAIIDESSPAQPH